MVDVVRDYRGKFLAEDTTLSIVITTADTATDCTVYVASYFTRSLCMHRPYVRVDDKPVFLDLDGSCSLSIVAGLSMFHDSCPGMTEGTLDVYDPPVWTFLVMDGRLHFDHED